MTFRTRLLLANSGILAVAMTAFGFGLIQLNRALQYRVVDQELTERLAFLRREPVPQRPIRAGPPPGMPPGGPPPRGPGPQGEEIDFWFRPLVAFRDGEPAMEVEALDPAALRRSLTEGDIFSLALWDGEPYRVLSGRDLSMRSAPFGPEGALVQLARPIGWIDDQAKTLTQTLLLLIPVALALGAGASVLLVRHTLRPVETMRKAAESIGESNLHERIQTIGQDEFAALGHTFNSMLDRLEAAFGRQKRFTADAAHELRTPLSRLRLAVSRALDSADPDEWRRVLELAARDSSDLAQLIDGLLLLAQADEGVLVGDLTSVDLRVPAAEAAGSEVQFDAPDHPVHVRGAETLLRRAIQNLVDNAQRHAPGTVSVSVSQQGSWATVKVIDRGPGIAPEHLDRLFDRFYRVDASRTRGTGFGLGLAIAKAISEAHGGSIAVEPGPGQGATFVIRLPIAPPRPGR